MEQLRYFLSVAAHRNFTEAAKAFYMTQPAIPGAGVGGKALPPHHPQRDPHPGG